MKTIRLDFLMGTDCSSWLIGLWGGSPHNRWSHCASVLEDGRYLDARNDRLGSVPPGIHIREPQIEAWRYKRRITIPVMDATYAAWEANLRAKIGDYYALPDIEGTILQRMLHRVGTYDCSALLVNALQHVQLLPFPLPAPAHEITPNMALLLAATCRHCTVGPIVASTSA
jgi:hypothetical protein